MKQTSFFTELKHNPMFKNLGAIAFLAILLVGIVVAMLAINVSQELRQQAADDDTVTTLSFSEQKKDFLYTELVKIPLIAQIPQGISLSGIQGWADISGQFPDAGFEFKPATIDGFDDPILKLENTSDQNNHHRYTLSIAYLVKSGQPFVTDGQPITLGNLEFPPASPGTVNIAFNPQLTKIEALGSSENLVKSFATQTFNLVYPSNSPTPTPTPLPTAIAVLSCNATCQQDSNCGTGFCYQPPMPSCPPGLACPQVMPAKVCRNQANPTSTTCEAPVTTPSPSPLACNTNCTQDSDCQTGYCYQPPMPTCPPGMNCIQAFPPKVCRNQTNPASTTCTPLASTPTPTPTGSANVCTSISFQTPTGQSTVKVSDNLSFTCGQIAGLEYYEFRVIRPDQTITTLPSVTEKSRTSQPYAVQIAGPHVVQCRACQAQAQDDSNQLTGCMNWENVPAQ